MEINKNKTSVVSSNTKSHNGLSAESKTVVPVKFNPKSLTELSANKLEQIIKPRWVKPNSLVQMAAEKIEKAIKQPVKITKPSKLLPTLKTLASQTLVKDKINYWENKANKDASIIKLDKKPIDIAIMREDELAKSRFHELHRVAHSRICLKID